MRIRRASTPHWTMTKSGWRMSKECRSTNVQIIPATSQLLHSALELRISFVIWNSSFIPEPLHRIDLRRPACGQPTRDQRNAREQQTDDREQDGIVRGQPKKLTGQQAACTER